MAFFPQGKFGRDVSWNMGAFAVQGICGLALNILIGRFYGPAPLGLFNQVFALYIFLSQLAVFGLHFSALRYVAEHHNDPREANAAALSAVVLTTLTASAATGLGWIGTRMLAEGFRNPDFGPAWVAALPGLWKTLIAVINAHSRMRAFAIAQAARYLLLLAALGWCVWRGVAAGFLTGILSVAEIILTVGLVLYAPTVIGRSRLADCRAWVGRHLDFGARSALSGALIELNSRVDVILLGFYLNDAAIGIYSLAAMFVEGGTQAFGIDGAAAAMGASFVAGVFFLKWLYRKRTGFAL